LLLAQSNLVAAVLFYKQRKLDKIFGTRPL